MNILFYDKDMAPGGIAVVTETLATALKLKGHRTGVYVLNLADDEIVNRLPNDVPVYEGAGIKISKRNVQMMRKVLIDNEIDVVVNQQGLNPIPITILSRARKGLKTKVISVYHLQVNTNGRIKGVEQQIERCHNKIKIPLLRLKLCLYKWITSSSMCYVYKKSDLYELLSPSFVPLFKEFTKIRRPKKLLVQANPVTLSPARDKVNIEEKKKEIIFVGRLDYMHKQPNRVLDMWTLLYKKFPDWNLTFVGDGPQKEELETDVRNKNIPNVNFVGFQSPRSYYETASILILTSKYEGLPLVIEEGMSYGVVPCVYDSFPACTDLIQDGVNGLILPKVNGRFDAQHSADLLSSIMSDQSRRQDMAKTAIETSQDFSLEKITKSWENVLASVIRGGVKLNLLKDKEIIFVGRLDNTHKRPHRVIETWKFLENRYPEWKLTFIGDGPERKELEDHVKALGLRRVFFVGFQNPIKYYQRASILLLTSDIEGFGLVLVEGMSFGVIPVAYASYTAVYDIIDNNKNGIIIPYHEDGYPAEYAAQKIGELIDDKDKRAQMAFSAIKDSYQYSLTTICKEWEKKLFQLIN